MIRRALFLLSAVAAFFFLSGAAAQERIPNGKDVVSTSSAASLEPAARGRSFELALVLKIRPGFHINAREVSEDYLIPTDLKADVPAGFKSGDVIYPKGELHTFKFSKTPLNVYQDQIVLKLPLTARANAPMGEQHIPLKLRYQACSQEICLPPVTLNVDAVVTVAAQARRAHPELFSSRWRLRPEASLVVRPDLSKNARWEYDILFHPKVRAKT